MNMNLTVASVDCLCSFSFSDFEGAHDATILSEQSEHLDTIEIRIKDCKGNALIQGVTLFICG